MGKRFVSEWAFTHRKRLNGCQKRKQILVTSSTTQRDVKKRVPSSVIEIERVTFSAFQAGGCSHCC